MHHHDVTDLAHAAGIDCDHASVIRAGVLASPVDDPADDPAVVVDLAAADLAAFRFTRGETHIIVPVANPALADLGPARTLEMIAGTF